MQPVPLLHVELYAVNAWSSPMLGLHCRVRDESAAISYTTKIHYHTHHVKIDSTGLETHPNVSFLVSCSSATHPLVTFSVSSTPKCVLSCIL